MRTMSVRCRTDSADETKALGFKLGSYLKPGHVVLFLANLGAGKTTFVQGLAKRFGVKEGALSPTFIIAQTLKGRVPLHHLDFYRLNIQEILGFGVQDYLNGAGEIKKGVVLMEWAERCRPLWPPQRLEIKIKILPRSKKREFVFRGIGDPYVGMVRSLKKEI